jgi:hypothetical protein
MIAQVIQDINWLRMISTLNGTENFSLAEGGPFHNAIKRLRLEGNQAKLVIATLCITWIPLVIITAIEGTLWAGTQLPFLKDYAMQARILVALQMAILIKAYINNNVTNVLRYFSEALMDAEERQKILSTALVRAKKLTNSGIAEVILLLMVFIATIGLLKRGVYGGFREGITSWMASADTPNITLSTAGYWAVLISIPLFQFLFLRWLWRYFVWILLLFRLSKARLNLLPTHADRAGGLGLIMLAQKSFNLIFVVGSVILSGQFMLRLDAHPESFNIIRNEVIGYIILSLFFVLVPLLFFVGQLIRLKNTGLLHLSVLGTTISQKFEQHWLKDLPAELGPEEKQVDPSLLFDYAGMYDQLQQLRILPVTLRDILGCAIILLVPFMPILFIHFSIAELLQRISSMLL